MDFEGHLGAVQQHPHVAPVHVKHPAYLVFIHLLQKMSAQDGPIFAGQLSKDDVHADLPLLLVNRLFNITLRIDHVYAIHILVAVA